MPELPIEDAIPRFKQNEDRVDQFVNGPDNATWQPSSGAPVPTLRKLIRDINTEGEGWLAQAEAAQASAQAAADALVQSNSATFTVGAVPFDITLPSATWIVDAVYITGLAQERGASWDQVGGTLTITNPAAVGLTGWYSYRSAATEPLQSGTIADGTAAVPSIRFTADPDTGIFRPGTNILGLSAGGAERLRLTTSGAQLTGLLTGTAVTQSQSDTTAGRLLKVGDFGLGSNGPLVTNLNDITVNGDYRIASANAATGNAPGGVGSWFVSHVRFDAASAYQIAVRASLATPEMHFRAMTGGVWQAWQRLDPSRNFDTPADLLASTDAARGEGATWQAGPYGYREAASGATDHHVTTAGGVKLYVLPGPKGYDASAFGPGKTHVEAQAACAAAAADGVGGVILPGGDWVFGATVNLPAVDLDFSGVRGVTRISGTASPLIAYPTDTSVGGVVRVQDVHDLHFTLSEGQTGIRCHQTWDGAGKRGPKIYNNDFDHTSLTTPSTTKSISLRGVWTAAIYGNSARGRFADVDRPQGGGYFVFCDLGADMNTSVMNVKIESNETVAVAYPVWMPPRVGTGRIEGVGISDNSFIAGNTAAYGDAVLSLRVVGNIISAWKDPIILDGCFDWQIVGNSQIDGNTTACITLRGTASSFCERGVVSGNGIKAFGSTAAIRLENTQGNSRVRDITISGNSLAPSFAVSPTAVGVDFVNTFTISSIAIVGNSFANLDTGVRFSAGVNNGGVSIEANAYTNVTTRVLNNDASVRVDAADYLAPGSLFTGDLNTLAGTRAEYKANLLLSGYSNAPAGVSGAGHVVLTAVYDANSAHQELWSINSGNRFSRRKTGGTWGGWGTIQPILSGTTANRPTTGLLSGLMYFDTTLGRPIWRSGSVWVDATGATV